MSVLRYRRGCGGRTYKAIVLSANLSDDAERTLTWDVSAWHEYGGRAEQHTNLGQDLVLLGLCLGHCAR
jgi:hypothetical protein